MRTQNEVASIVSYVGGSRKPVTVTMDLPAYRMLHNQRPQIRKAAMKLLVGHIVDLTEA